MKFLDGLDPDLRAGLLQEFRALWTHTSTALEGNTLTLGETAFVLNEGLTIAGKSLKDHKDVEGHARALDLGFSLLSKEDLQAQDIFDLHSLVITEREFDVYRPVGAWRNDYSSTVYEHEGKQGILEYPHFSEVQGLMGRWIKEFNKQYNSDAGWEDAQKAYVELHVSFVAIHPFYDGNGRVARIVSNLPLLKAGYPPIIIDTSIKYNYIKALQHYTHTYGVPSKDTLLLHPGKVLEQFATVVEKSVAASQALIRQARELQRRRDENRQGCCDISGVK